MSNEFEQKIDKTDLQALIKKADEQEKEIKEKEKRDSKYDFWKMVLTPLAIALFTMLATVLINDKQIESAYIIANQQRESAKLIEEAKQKQSAEIAESNQEIARLNQVKEIFQTILTTHEKKPINKELLKMEIASLEVYREDALIYLLNIRNHYEQKKNKLLQTQKRYNSIQTQSMYPPSTDSQEYQDLQTELAIYSNLYVVANSTIQNIIKNNQIDISHVEIIGTDNQVNLRYKQFNNYNFFDCWFDNVNLYRADFTDSTLVRAKFDNSDLYGATFSRCILTKASFNNVDLRKANFQYAKLAEVQFSNPIKNRNDDECKTNKELCQNSCQLEGALFSLGSLMKVDKPPFNKLFSGSADQKKIRLKLYVNLLLPHRDSIKKWSTGTIPKDQQDKIKTVLDAAGWVNVDSLLDLLNEEARRMEMYSSPADTSANSSRQVKRQANGTGSS